MNQVQTPNPVPSRARAARLSPRRSRPGAPRRAPIRAPAKRAARPRVRRRHRVCRRDRRAAPRARTIVSAGRGDRAGATELDADDAIPPRERERRLDRVEPGQRAGLVGVREQNAGASPSPRGSDRRRRPRRGAPRPRRRRGSPFARARAPPARPPPAPPEAANSPRPGRHAASRVCRQILRGEPDARTGVGDDRRAADDDDAARARLDVAREQWLDAALPRACPRPADRRRPRRHVRLTAACAPRRAAARAALAAEPPARSSMRPWTRPPATGAGSVPSSITSPTAIRSGGTRAGSWGSYLTT